MRRIALFILLFISACALPQKEAVLQTESAQTQIAYLLQTKWAESPTPSVTPIPTHTPTLEPTPQPTVGPTTTPTLGPNFFHGSHWYQISFVSQDGLKFQGRAISTGCTAASLQMVLEFWHSFNESYPLMTAQQLIDRNASNFDVKTGLNITQCEDELNEMGYYFGIRRNSNKEDLLAALERFGPLPILTKTNWNPFGTNHMAVVSGYNEEDDIIQLMDPWVPGGVYQTKYENFDGIWSLNYLNDETEEMRRTFFFIIPQKEIRERDELFIPNFDNPNCQ